MANDDFPGFIEDEPKAKPAAAPPRVADPFAGQDVALPGARKPGPPAPRPAGSAAPVADPFAGQDVALPGASRTGGPPAPVKPPAAAKAPAGPPAAKPGAAPADEAVDPDLKPGSRKDLWKCPHCGTGNKPERDTCRTCGKSPRAPVAKPWYANPLVLAPAAGVIALAVWGWVATRPDLSLKPAGTVDAAPRRGGGGGTHPLGDGFVFNAEGRLAASGRVIAVAAGPRGQLVALALGATAGDEAAFAKARASLDAGSAQVSDAPGHLVCYLLTVGDQPLPVQAGSWLSFAGEVGTVSSNMMLVRDFTAGPVVLVREHAVR